MKNGVRNMRRWDTEIPVVRRERPNLQILTCHDEYLLHTMFDVDGALVGYGGLAPEPLIELIAAGKAKDYAKARAIHDRSPRRENAFVTLNCAAVPAELIESELFGYEKGAFTGAQSLKKGRFELAEGGTLFLDEIGDLNASIAVKLLRVVQEREFDRLGGTKTIKADVRLIVATNKDLEKAIAAITERIRAAKSIVAFPAFTVQRLRLQKEAQQAIEALGCPFATTTMEKCIIDESHPQFAGLYAGAVSAEKTRQIVEDAELVLDLGGISLNDETTAGFSGRLDSARFVSIGLNDVRIGQQVFGNVRLADVLAALAKVKSPAHPYKRTPEQAQSVNAKPADKITMDPLYSRYAAFIRSGDNIVLESGSSSLGLPPMTLADDVQVHIQMLWGSIGWATGAAFGVAIADPNRRTILVTGEGSHQLTANEIGNMGRYGANPIILVLNNDGYMVERALEPNPDWSYNDLAKWRYADLPHALGCADWITARVETIGELDAAMKAARESKSGAYIEVIGGRMDMPKALAFAHTRIKELYGSDAA